MKKRRERQQVEGRKQQIIPKAYNRNEYSVEGERWGLNWYKEQNEKKVRIFYKKNENPLMYVSTIK